MEWNKKMLTIKQQLYVLFNDFIEDKADKIQNKQNDFACLFAIIFLNVF